MLQCVQCVAVCCKASQYDSVSMPVDECVAVCVAAYVVVCCSVLQCVAVSRSMARSVFNSLHCVLQCVAVCRSVSQCVAV